MKRPLLACLGLLAALVPGPAGAATTYYAVDDEGPGVSALNLSCDDPHVNNPLEHFSHVSGPGTPPLGTGSLKLDLSSDKRSGLHFEGGSSRDFSELVGPGAFAVSAYSPAGTGVIAAYLEATVFSGTWHGVALLPLTVGMWTPLDLSSATYHWVHVSEEATDLTPMAFLDEKGDGSFKAGVMADDCTGDSPVYVDKLIGHHISGAPSVIDFEAVYPTTVAMSGGGLIVAGKPITISGALGTPGPLSKGNRTLQLQADPWPFDGNFVDVAVSTTDDNGQAAFAHRPTVNTTYRWQFPGLASYAPATSETVVIDVSPLVTMAVKDTTLARGQKVRVTGTTSPAKAGVKVHLMRRVKGGDVVRLATRKTRADGSYRLAKRLKKSGTWRIYVVVAADGGNVQGKAFRAKVRVR